MDRSSIFIGVVAALMLAGGGWVVVKRYQERAADSALRDQVKAIAEDWAPARACLTNAPPNSREDPVALRRSMTRARDRSMALEALDARYPYRCFPTARSAIERLDALAPPAGGGPRYEFDFAEASTARPFASTRLAVLAELILAIDLDVTQLFTSNGGEGSPFPTDVTGPSSWDDEVLPPFPDSDDCLPTAVSLRLGADEPLRDVVDIGERRLVVVAASPPGVSIREGDAGGPILVSTAVELPEPILRTHACATDSTLHVILATETRVQWMHLNDALEVVRSEALGDGALATALRGEDGREVLIACDDAGPSLVHVAEEGTRLWVCSTDGCESPEPRTVGLPRVGVARLGDLTVVLSYPPDGRVAVVDAYDGTHAVGGRQVVPTIDDRGDPELTTTNERFVLRLCGTELHSVPDAVPGAIVWQPLDTDASAAH